MSRAALNLYVLEPFDTLLVFGMLCLPLLSRTDLS